jgi:enoyl-CoA hydratase/carnithine racemase
MRWKLTPTTFRDVLFGGRQFTGDQALQLQLVDDLAVDDRSLLDCALRWVEKISPRDHATYVATKEIVFDHLVQLLDVADDSSFHVRRSSKL